MVGHTKNCDRILDIIIANVPSRDIPVSFYVRTVRTNDNEIWTCACMVSVVLPSQLLLKKTISIFSISPVIAHRNISDLFTNLQCLCSLALSLSVHIFSFRHLRGAVNNTVMAEDTGYLAKVMGKSARLLYQ